ncbi:MAG: STAS domain-containing protein [Actinobacteria bacterium]|nr:STAS domain-containing protein [Actinomycetota bacterium]
MANTPESRAVAEAQAEFTRAGTADAPELAIRGEVDVSTSAGLRDELYRLIDGGATRVVIDCSEMDFIDSSGLGVLVGALKRMREKDGEVVLRALNPSARKVFEITGLTKLFTIE